MNLSETKQCRGKFHLIAPCIAVLKALKKAVTALVLLESSSMEVWDGLRLRHQNRAPCKGLFQSNKYIIYHTFKGSMIEWQMDFCGKYMYPGA